MARPVIHHRSPAFREIVRDAHEGLKFLFQTRHHAFFTASSGTGAMEGALASTLSHGDKIVVVRGGKFGDRWTKIGAAYGLDPIVYDVEWGKAADPDQVEKILDEESGIRAVCVQASETSTGVAHPIEPLAKIVTEREDVLLIVDGITAVGVMNLPTDEWGIDVLVAGSQKALMLPPGLAMGAFTSKAAAAMERSNLPSFYFDLKKEAANQASGTTSFTPAVSLLYGLQESLAMMREETLEACFARHDRLARATRAGLKGMGLELFAPDSPSPALTAVKAPDGVDGQEVVRGMREKHAITIAGGQDHLKGKIFRLSHMGYVADDDLMAGLVALGDVLADLGAKADARAGVSAFLETLQA